MKGEVESEVSDALIAIGLDHLISASVTGTDITDNSIIASMTSKSATADWDSFNNTTDALEAIADGVGGGGLTAQETRDAMKLAPTAGAPASGSIDEHLDDILADTADIQPNYATSTAQTTAQNDLDIITGTDGTTLATTQGNYAPIRLTDAVEGIYDVQDVLCIMASILSGKLSTTGSTATFRGLEDSENRATVTFAAGGNRSAVTFDLTGCN
jgi:hypothetical protein